MSDQPQSGNLRGSKLPELGTGLGARLLGSVYRNFVIQTCNAFRNLSVRVPQYDATTGGYKGTVDADIKMTANGTVITLPKISVAGGGGGGGSVPFSGVGAPGAGTLSSSVSYLAGPVPSLYVDMTNKVLYVCTTAGSNSTSVWAQISGGGGGTSSIVQLKMMSDAGDYWLAQTWNGTTLGGHYLRVYKPAKLMAGPGAIATETIRGQVQNYAYALGPGGGYYIRTVTDGVGNVIERDVVIPDMLVGDIIDALPGPNLGAIVNAATIALGGSGYTVGDVLTLSGGLGGQPAKITVDTVSSGVITAAHLSDSGSYTTWPPLTGCGVTGGTGTGATFNLTLIGGLRALADGRAWSEI